jgi:two-component system, NtrC family, C4-dicarboxylate transport sensor histidine kinase DctB
MIKYRSLPLLFVIGFIVLAWYGARSYLHANTENNDANDLAMLAIADTTLFFATASVLFVVIVTQLWLERQRLQLQQQLQQAKAAINQQLDKEAQLRQLSNLGILAGSLAHELGQPLSAARVGLEGLHYLRQLGREPSPQHIESTLSRVGMSLLTMTQIIEHLRSLAGSPQATRLETLDLAHHVDAIIHDRGQWLRFNDIQITWVKPNTPVLAIGEAAGLRLIVTNLLRNAVEAVANQTQDRRLVKVTVGPDTTIIIHDSGPGIPDSVMKNMFEPFTTTKRDGVHGIGLSLAKVSAARMGGDLSVSSSTGSGTIFSLRLLAVNEAINSPLVDLP